MDAQQSQPIATPLQKRPPPALNTLHDDCTPGRSDEGSRRERQPVIVRIFAELCHHNVIIAAMT
jgi:hypothetical protein